MVLWINTSSMSTTKAICLSVFTIDFEQAFVNIDGEFFVQIQQWKH